MKWVLRVRFKIYQLCSYKPTKTGENRHALDSAFTAKVINVHLCNNNIQSGKIEDDYFLSLNDKRVRCTKKPNHK